MQNKIMLFTSTKCETCDKFKPEWNKFLSELKDYKHLLPLNFITHMNYNPSSKNAIEKRREILKYAKQGKDGYPLLLFYIDGKRWKPYWFDSNMFRNARSIMYSFLIHFIIYARVKELCVYNSGLVLKHSSSSRDLGANKKLKSLKCNSDISPFDYHRIKNPLDNRIHIRSVSTKPLVNLSVIDNSAISALSEHSCKPKDFMTDYNSNYHHDGSDQDLDGRDGGNTDEKKYNISGSNEFVDSRDGRDVSSRDVKYLLYNENGSTNYTYDEGDKDDDDDENEKMKMGIYYINNWDKISQDMQNEFNRLSSEKEKSSANYPQWNRIINLDENS